MKQQPNVPLNLTHARRKLVAELVPILADRLKTQETASRTIRFTLKELQQIAAKCKAAIPKATERKVRDALEHVVAAATKALGQHEEGGIGRIPAAERVYQFKITLRGIAPPIWRRIQTKDCTLDFEGCLRAEKGTRYPLCIEGERACPPEDVGGIYGYQELLEAMADPDNDRHEEFMEWCEPFDPEAFDAKAATGEMRKGLPNWGEME